MNDNEHVRRAIAAARHAADQITRNSSAAATAAEAGYGQFTSYGAGGAGGAGGAAEPAHNPFPTYYGEITHASHGPPPPPPPPPEYPSMAPVTNYGLPPVTSYALPPGYSLVPTASVGTDSGRPRGRSRSRSPARRGRSRSRSPARRRHRRHSRSRSRSRERGRMIPRSGEDARLIETRPDMVYIQFPKDLTKSDAILRNPTYTGEVDSRSKGEVSLCNTFIVTGRCLHRQFCRFRHIEDPEEFHKVRRAFMKKDCRNHICRFSVICPHKHEDHHYNNTTRQFIKELERKVKNYEPLTYDENAFVWKWMFISSEDVLAKQHLYAASRTRTYSQR